MAEVSGELRGALQRGEMELHFQPELDLATSEITGLEALLRWAHPERGLLWPADFMPTAEAEGLGQTLGAWVLSAALTQARRIAAGRQLWVNAFAAELFDDRYPERVATALTGVTAVTLGIDLPERALLGLDGRSVAVCGELRQAGALLALDHTEPDSHLLDNLARHHISAVKIGRRFIQGVDVRVDAQEAVADIVARADEQGAIVVAIGIESWSEARVLNDIGVRQAHGFLLLPPMRADRVQWALGRSDSGRGSYATDGSGWLTPGKYSTQLGGALPMSHASYLEAGVPLQRRGIRSVPSFGGTDLSSRAGIRGAGQVGPTTQQLPGFSAPDPFGRSR